VKGTIVAIGALGLLTMIHKDVGDVLNEAVLRLRVDPDNWYVHTLITRNWAVFSDPRGNQEDNARHSGVPASAGLYRHRPKRDRRSLLHALEAVAPGLPNPRPRVQPGAESVEGTIIGEHGAPGVADSSTQELAAWVEHAITYDLRGAAANLTTVRAVIESHCRGIECSSVHNAPMDQSFAPPPARSIA